MAKLASVTGIAYSYKGTTVEVPRSSNIDTQSAELVVAVTTPARTDLGIGGTVLGYGGYHYWKWQTTSATGQVWAGAAIGRGWVVVDVAGLMRLQPGFGAGLHRGNVLLHELAHSVGLDHVANPQALMNATLEPAAPPGYAPGDVQGLKAVGRSAGCITVPSGTIRDLS